MRELKFKIFWKNVMSRPGTLYEVSQPEFDSWSDPRPEDPKEVILQYTGIKDINEKEIYEGDIVKCKTGWDSLREFTSIVIYEQGMFGVRMEQHGDQQLKLTSFELEVLGNIYETPELIQGVS